MSEREVIDTIGRILVVDDDESVGRSIGRQVQRLGLIPRIAVRGSEALSLLESEIFDVVISDVSMPGLGGLGLLQALRDRGLEIPVVLLTGSTDVESAAAALELGACRYLTKPMDPERLRTVLFQALESHRSQSSSSQLATRLDIAIRTLAMAYQPIVRWSSRLTLGYEALVRPTEEKLCNPGALYAAAEKLERVPELGRAIRTAVAADVPRDAPPGALIFVNVHPVEFDDDELLSPDAPLSALASRVVLELTEQHQLDRPRELAARLRALRSMGYRIALDDFGAGYSSLSRLSEVEPDVVKLDKSLVQGVESSSRRRSILRSLSQLCSSELHISVVCEGVELRRELAALIGERMDLFQGYLFARPAPGFAPPSWEAAQTGGGVDVEEMSP